MSPKFIFIPSGVTPPSFLFDTYPGLFGISAARQLKSGIAAIERDRRSSDNAETDVLVGTGEKLLTSPVQAGGDLGTWVGANDAFVSQPYDQSGNGTSITQPAAASQPQSISSGALITLGTKAAWQPTLGGWKTSGNIDLTGATDVWFFFVIEISQTSTSARFIMSSDGSGETGTSTEGGYDFFVAPNDTAIRFRYASTDAGTMHQWNTSSLGFGTFLVSGYIKPRVGLTPDMKLYVNGVENGSFTSGSGSGGSFDAREVAFLERSNGTLPTNDKVQEWLIYYGDQSANRAAIEANINAFYNIY